MPKRQIIWRFLPDARLEISLEDGIVQEPDHGCVKTYETLIEGEHVYLVY